MEDRAAWLEKQIVPLRRGLERAYDEVIEKQEKELKRRDEEHQKELKKSDEHGQILSGYIDEHTIENAYLVEENARLKYQLKKQGQCASAPIEQDDETPGGGNISADEYRHLTDKYNELNKKYQETNQRLKYIERKNVALVQQNRNMKENVRAWQKYCDHLENKHKLKSEARLTASPKKQLVANERDAVRPSISSSPGPTTIRTPRSLIGLEASSPAPINLLTHVELSFEEEPITNHSQDSPGAHAASIVADTNCGEPLEQHKDQPTTGSPQKEAPEVPVPANIYNTSAIPEQHFSSARLDSSQTTEDEIATQLLDPVTSNSEHDDVPEFVSERSLKRKRATATKFDVYTDRVPLDGTPTNPFRVKEEPFSSPPAQVTTLHLLRKETMDLDELGPNVISTPHRRRKKLPSTHANLTGTLNHQRCTSFPFVKNEVIEDENRTEDENFFEHIRTKGLDGKFVETRACSEPSNSRRSDPEVLQQLDLNIQTTGPTENEAPSKRRKRDEARQFDKFQMFTESGEKLPSMNENYKRLAPNVARAQFNRRLQASRDIQTPVKTTHKSPAAIHNMQSVAQIPTPPSSSNRPTYTASSYIGSRKGLSSEVLPASREELVSTSRPAWQLQLNKGQPSDNRDSPRKGTTSKQQKQAPLRTKPKSELRTSDFKANPTYNHGYSYAFAETVRKRADRACLPGCTRPECCGSTFRALAAVAGPLSAFQEEKILEEYLGDTYDSMQLTQMSLEERKELVLQARTRQMAKQHGRHRQAYERHTTPPGFWRIDFPTTQEDMEDRRKAAEMEKVLVEERWMEAMRKGGRWMFRDE
ncbi:SAE2-domain-containing protein [Melanomma pulvis-pyrius CBS 109.77]|uniref:SAE2-domain-containing protein n=1 Tax=Melanomma pulvis-pyrius CBS 109.77 TaxID=1314802 RepID=A0A6A6X732_9PLEO|nr:SAE2-domain-containing protein [Melanomma pulvis-pyrius CBS 109.77]